MNTGNDVGMVCSQIWKFPLEGAITILSIPKGAIIRHAAVQILDQTARACLWLEVQPDQPKETRIFRMFDTGEDIPFKPLHRAFIATLGKPLTNDEIVHIYEVFNQPKP